MDRTSAQTVEGVPGGWVGLHSMARCGRQPLALVGSLRRGRMPGPARTGRVTRSGALEGVFHVLTDRWRRSVSSSHEFGRFSHVDGLP